MDGNSKSDVQMEDRILVIPSELRDLVEKSVDQTEKAFGFFFQAARGPSSPPSDLALDLAQRNMAIAFESARKLAQAKDMQETIALQAEFLRIQIGYASEFMSQLAPKR
jgi:hypothetical protein